MQVIGQATRDLIANFQRQCPRCNAPGVRVIDIEPGLPCMWCGQPTELPFANIYGCRHCNYQTEARFPDGKKTASPQYCIHCNP